MPVRITLGFLCSRVASLVSSRFFLFGLVPSLFPLHSSTLPFSFFFLSLFFRCTVTCDYFRILKPSGRSNISLHLLSHPLSLLSLVDLSWFLHLPPLPHGGFLQILNLLPAWDRWSFSVRRLITTSKILTSCVLVFIFSLFLRLLLFFAFALFSVPLHPSQVLASHRPYWRKSYNTRPVVIKEKARKPTTQATSSDGCASLIFLFLLPFSRFVPIPFFIFAFLAFFLLPQTPFSRPSDNHHALYPNGASPPLVVKAAFILITLNIRTGMIIQLRLDTL